MAVIKIWDETTQAYTEVPVIKGDPGPAYILTDTDKAAIVNQVLAEFVNAAEVAL